MKIAYMIRRILAAAAIFLIVMTLNFSSADRCG